MIDKSKIYLRKADISDALLTYKWAIDPVTRFNSLNQDFFSFDSHLLWFTNKINTPDTMYFILMERFPLGQIRFDKYEDGWLISFLIDEIFRGLGLGKIIVENGLKTLKKNKYYAYVKKDNIPSLKIFRNLCFEEIESDKEGTIKFLKKC
jgi:RimJ/RimL family protein N-acetyltransferase